MSKQILDYLTTIGVSYSIVEHEPVFTVAESMAHMPSSYPVKNLLLKEEKGDRCIFVIMKGDERLDTKWLAKELGVKKLQFAKPEVLMQKMGVLPGSASLFNLLYKDASDVQVIVDDRLVSQPKTGFHPTVNTKTVYIEGKDIAKFLLSLGRPYRVLNLGSH